MAKKTPAKKQEETAVATIDPNQLQRFDEELFSEAATSADYYPRLQLLSSNSAKCKSGEFPINHFAIIKDQQHVDAGAEVSVIPLCWRPKALEIGDEVVSNFDPRSEEFQRIKKESGKQNSGCMYGPEFLCYVPEHDQFVTFFMGSKSLRRESSNVLNLMKQVADTKDDTTGVTLVPNKVEAKGYVWYTPIAKPCREPLEVPDPDQASEHAETFNNPTNTEVETTEDEGRAR